MTFFHSWGLLLLKFNMHWTGIATIYSEMQINGNYFKLFFGLFICCMMFCIMPLCVHGSEIGFFYSLGLDIMSPLSLRGKGYMKTPSRSVINSKCLFLKVNSSFANILYTVTRTCMHRPRSVSPPFSAQLLLFDLRWAST